MTYLLGPQVRGLWTKGGEPRAAIGREEEAVVRRLRSRGGDLQLEEQEGLVPSDRCLDAVLSAAAAAIRCHEEYPDNQNVGAASGVLAAVGILQRMWREGRKPSGAAPTLVI